MAIKETGDAIGRASEAALSSILAGHTRAAWAAAESSVAQNDQLLADLLGGRTSFADLLERGGRLGLQFAAPYTVVALTPDGHHKDFRELVLWLEPALRARLAVPGCLVGQYADGLVALVPVPPAEAAQGRRSAGDTVVEVLRSPRARRLRWRIGVGRPRPGVHGIRLSYEEAREALEISEASFGEVLDPNGSGLLLHRVIGRDRAAMTELIRAVLLPLSTAHQGPDSLLETLEAYFASGCMATKSALELRLSVRAVSYRLARIRDLTKHDVNIPAQRLALEVALRGARVLGWPRQPLPDC